MIYAIFRDEGCHSLIPVGASSSKSVAWKAWNETRLKLLATYRKKRDKWEAVNAGHKNRTYRNCVKALKVEDPKELLNYPHAQPVWIELPEL